MALKLASKTLPSKYAEQLYKNEVNYSKEINKRYDRLITDFNRYTQMIDMNSQVFLNRVRNKRTQWRKDDAKYREYYKAICRNFYVKYLENNPDQRDYSYSNRIPQINTINAKPKINHSTLDLKPEKKTRSLSVTNIREHSNLKLPPLSRSPAESAALTVRSVHEQIRPFDYLSVDKSFKKKPIDENKPFAGGQFSTYDRQFIDKIPDQVELTVTDVGKRYLDNKRQQHTVKKKQKQKYTELQEYAVKDTRFKNLVSSLDTRLN